MTMLPEPGSTIVSPPPAVIARGSAPFRKTNGRTTVVNVTKAI
ncbi:MAG TPA: hypothetical protein VMM80_05890 [Bacteroidota bacterium]|nr:hypothetical protein [Bacteroidota bacterium]